MGKGLFIVFEGPDGSGKTTLTQAVFNVLQRIGVDSVLTREPGGTPISEKIRSIILDRDNAAMTDKTELILFAAARSQHINEFIFPAIDAGKIVICDRFHLSTRAYQGHGRGYPLDLISSLDEIAVGKLRPDATFMIKVSAETAQSRLKQTGKIPDRIEQSDADFYSRVRNGYLKEAEGYPNLVMLDGEMNIESLCDIAIKKILSL